MPIGGTGTIVQAKYSEVTAQTASTQTKNVGTVPSYVAAALVHSFAFTPLDGANNTIVVEVDCGVIQNTIAADYTQLFLFADNGGTGNVVGKGSVLLHPTSNGGGPHSFQTRFAPGTFSGATTFRLCLWGQAVGTRTLNTVGSVAANTARSVRVTEHAGTI